MSPAMADWSLLPQELLQLISKKLDDEIFLLRFRSVCSTWRSSIPKPHNHHHFPLLLHLSLCPNILDIHNIFLIKPPATPTQQSLRPWLVRISSASASIGKVGNFDFWHPLGKTCFTDYFAKLPSRPRALDFSQLSVFNIGQRYIRGTTEYHYYESSVAVFQEGRPLDILIRKNPWELMMLRHGDDSWTKIPNVARESHRDICIFKGRPCVTYETGRTVMIGSDFSTHLVAEPVFGRFDGSDIKITVDNESELLLVRRYMDDYDGDEFTDDYDGGELVRIDLFRLDEKEKKWVKLANLGDKVLLWGQGYSFIASASDLGFDNGNFVIYFNGNYDAVGEMSIFHLDQGRNLRLSDSSDYFKLFWPPPEWITSRCL